MTKAKERWHCICGEPDWCEHMCACHVTLGGLIDYCSVHRSAPELLDALKQLAHVANAKGLNRVVVASIVANAWKAISKAKAR